MDTSDIKHQIEIGVSHRYAQEHGWVVNAITGFLSAYYMEDPRFRVTRRFQELETGVHVWVCEIEATMSIERMVKRLQLDIPPAKVHHAEASTSGLGRYTIDLVETAREAG